MTNSTEAERARRRPVWAALSELFLDTETRPSVGLAAAACLASGYSDQTLEAIWRNEVSPVLAPNLLSPAGEWAGIDLDWLEAQIMKRRRGLLDGAAAWINKGHWSEVRRLITWLRGWSEDRRAPVALGLHTIVWMALDDIWAQSLDGSNLSEEERRRIWDEAAVPLLTALHVKGFDPPLPALLAQGRAAMDQ